MQTNYDAFHQISDEISPEKKFLRNFREFSARLYCLDPSELSRINLLGTLVSLIILRENLALPKIRGELFRETVATIVSW